MNGLALYCPLPITHPARAYVPACSTDVAKTWREHSANELKDDYELVESQDWIGNGEFKS